MRFEDTTLPWTGAPVRKISNLHAYLSEHLPRAAGQYLPASITLFLDPEIEESAVSDFLREMPHQLDRELRKRMLRQDVFVKLGLFTRVEIESFLTARTDAQPWAIYYSREGGLGISGQYAPERDSARGVIPCSSMPNHGVAWNRTQAGGLELWLATARKEGLDWDWESDIGHESAHSAFAQVPFFVQAVQQIAQTSPLSAVDSVLALDPGHLAWFFYFYSELAVVAMRGESRPTETGLPVAQRDELYALLKLSHELIPNAGFRQALAAYARVNGSIDVNQGNAIYEIAAPIMRIIPHLTRFTKAVAPPTLSLFRDIVGRNQSAGSTPRATRAL